MSKSTIHNLSTNPELFERFQRDPLGTLAVMQEMTGGASARLTVADIDLIKSLSREELQVLYGIIEKMRALNIPNFKL
jgi:hypothetical protein